MNERKNKTSQTTYFSPKAIYKREITFKRVLTAVGMESENIKLAAQNHPRNTYSNSGFIAI